MIRQAQVAGQFYPANPSALKQQIAGFVDEVKKKEDAFGLVSPHAGYIFSGRVAGACFSGVNLTKTVVILGPNHTGVGPPFSIMPEGKWQMPLGQVEIDAPKALMILAKSQHLKRDFTAHRHEHSIEVELPFLQYFLPEVKIVPIIISAADFDTYDEIGKAMAAGLKGTQEKCLIVASSDMTHYEPEAIAKEKDNLAIQAILNLDGKELLKRVKKFNITMCGFGPVICMLSAARRLGAKTARLIKYETSGQASGDYSQVVGYAGIIVQ